jgi:hypothetical protein
MYGLPMQIANVYKRSKMDTTMFTLSIESGKRKRSRWIVCIELVWIEGCGSSVKVVARSVIACSDGPSRKPRKSAGFAGL